MRIRRTNRDRHDQPRIAVVLDYGEYFLYAAVAIALGVGGVMLLGVVLYEFLRGLTHGPYVGRVLSLLSGLLLVFIFTELISTLRVIIATREVNAEPFLIVGIVAAIRRVLVIGAEAENLLGTPRFRDVILEIVVLAGTVLVLGVTVFVLRAARMGEPATKRGPTERP